jgi:hypothetical protein
MATTNQNHDDQLDADLRLEQVARDRRRAKAKEIEELRASLTALLPTAAAVDAAIAQIERDEEAKQAAEDLEIRQAETRKTNEAAQRQREADRARVDAATALHTEQAEAAMLAFATAMKEIASLGNNDTSCMRCAAVILRRARVETNWSGFGHFLELASRISYGA